MLLGMACGESVAGSAASCHLALELGESLVARGAVEPELVLERWLRLDHPVRPRPGSITSQALQLFEDGFPVEGLAEAAARVVPGRSGDGPLIRALPLAIAARHDGAQLKRWANQSASITHSDLTTRMATVGSCLLARDLLTRSLADSLARVAQAVREEAPLRLARALRLPSRDEWPEAGDDAAAVLSQAVHGLASATDLEGVLQQVENQDQPRAGALALAGGLGGAAFGINPAAPRLARLDRTLRFRLEQLAEGLVDFQAHQDLSRTGADSTSASAARDS